MKPYLFSLGSYQVGTYGVLVGVAILVCLWMTRTLGTRDGLPVKKVNDVGLGIFVCGLVGSKLLGVLVNLFTGVPVDVNELRMAGAIHGGLIGGLLGAYVLTHFFKLPRLLLLDASLPAVAVAQGIGRLGCFAAGCCFGTESAGPLSVVFTDPAAHTLGGAPLHVGLHPVQLYDALYHFAVAAGLTVLHKKRLLVGSLFGPWCILEGVGRFSLETIRGDLGRGVWLGTDWLSTGRLTALGFILAGVLFLLLRRRFSPAA